MERSTKPTVLVTGCNGYTGSWITYKLLEAGEYNVCGTLRKISDEKTKLLKDAFGSLYDKLALYSAEMTDPDSIENAIKTSKCDYIIHTAAPLTFEVPKDEEDFLNQNKIGTDSVLRFGLKHGVKRVVYTSSIAAIEDWSKGDIEVDEGHWHDTSGLSDEMHRTKFAVEKGLWDFYDNLTDEEREGFDVVVLNPSYMIGPQLVNAPSAAQALITRIIDGTYSGFPPAHINFVDVRDVADAHIKALTCEANRRYIISKDMYPIKDIVDSLAKKCNKIGYNLGYRQSLKPVLWMVACIDPTTNFWYTKWDARCKCSNEASKEVLKMEYLPLDKSLHEMTDTLLKFEFVADKSK